MNLYIIGFIIIGLIWVIGGGTLIFKSIVNRALKNIIRPHFKTLEYEVKKVETTGFFSTAFPDELGFKDEDPSAFLGSGGGMGKAVNYTYINLFIRNVNGKRIRIPARIKTVFFSITKVEYGKATKLN